MQHWERGAWLRRILARTPVLLVVVAAAGASWRLANHGVDPTVSVRGFAEAQERQLGPVRAGRVLHVRVKPGQAVRAGDVVATLDAREVEAKRQVAEAVLAQARARVAAEADAQQSNLARAESVALMAKATQERDRAELAEATAQVQRLEQLAAENLVPALEVERARRDQSGLAARVGVYAATPVAQGSKDTGPSRVAVRLGPYREAVRAAEAAVREVDLALEELQVRAPVDGTVTAVLKGPGEVVAAGAPIVTLVTARPGMVVAWIPERLASRVDVGNLVSVERKQPLSEPEDGRVVELSPRVEEVPPRARVSTTVPAWGRWALVQTHVDLVPGEAVHVRF